MADEMFTLEDLNRACDHLATLPFFPKESRGPVMTTLRRMCPHKRALEWLVAEVVNHVPSWPGLAELRGILCSHFDPADGIDHWSTLPGYSAADGEARFLLDHEEIKARELAANGDNEFLRQLKVKVKLIP